MCVMVLMMNLNNGGLMGVLFGLFVGVLFVGVLLGLGLGVCVLLMCLSECVVFGMGVFVDYGVYKTKGALKFKVV